MPKAKNPEARIMEYFETAPLEAAKAVHAIAKGVLHRRSQTPFSTPPVKGAKAAKAAKGATVKGATAKNPEVVVRKPKAKPSDPPADPAGSADPAAPEVLG